MVLPEPVLAFPMQSLPSENNRRQRIVKCLGAKQSDLQEEAVCMPAGSQLVRE